MLSDVFLLKKMACLIIVILEQFDCA